MRVFLLVLSAGVVVACASQPVAPTASILPAPTVGYSCENQIKLQVRLDGPSASVVVDGAGPFTLPQISSTGDLTVFSDGQRVMQIKAGRVSFGLGRAVPAACLSR
jgi:hypothetical protein